MGLRRSRPGMAGYGISDDDEGLLEWAEAARRLTVSRNYWVATVRPDGRPHVMPVWAVWLGGALWFSSSTGSRKVRNLRAEPRCTVTTEQADRPVVLDGVAEIVLEPALIAAFLAASNEKYEVSYGIDFLDPAVNATVRVHPTWVFALDEDTFTTSPTVWTVTGRVTDPLT